MNTVEEIISFFEEEGIELPKPLPPKTTLNRLYDLSNKFFTLVEGNGNGSPFKAADIFDKAFTDICSTEIQSDKKVSIFNRAIKSINKEFEALPKPAIKENKKAQLKVLTTAQSEFVINEMRKGKTFTLEGNKKIIFVPEIDNMGRKGYYIEGKKVKRDDLYEILRVTGVTDEI